MCKCVYCFWHIHRQVIEVGQGATREAVGVYDYAVELREATNVVFLLLSRSCRKVFGSTPQKRFELR
jgi:hypothetical protein